MSLVRPLLFIVATAVVLACAAPLAKGALLGIITSVATLGLTALFVRWERVRLADVGVMPNSGSPARLAAGFAIGLLTLAAWAALSIASGQLRFTRVQPFDIRAIAPAVFTYFFLAFREELAFHGYPLRTLQRHFGVWPAQLLVAVLFALEHKIGGSTWTDAFLGPGAGSLLFGMAAIATRGLAVPVGIHAGWNVGHWSLGLKGAPAVWQPMASNDRMSIAIYDLVMLAVTLAFWLWHRRVEKR